MNVTRKQLFFSYLAITCIAALWTHTTSPSTVGYTPSEISNHILTKRELAEREEELSQSVDANNWNIEDSRIQHFHQVETISKLTAELAQEVEEHELS